MARKPGDYSMLRRSFCWAVVGVLVAPRLAIAQASKGVHRIGRLESGGPLTPEDIRKEVDALREFGWVEGQNLHTERRYANGHFEALQPLAEELVRAKVEVIVTGGTAATSAAMRATKTIPIVFRIAYDPVGNGLVASLAHPGGNVMGFSAASPGGSRTAVGPEWSVVPRSAISFDGSKSICYRRLTRSRQPLVGLY